MAKEKQKATEQPSENAGRGRGARPTQVRATLRRLLHYLGARKRWIVLALVLTFISTASSLAIAALMKPAINKYILPGDFPGLAKICLVLIAVAVVGALASAGQTQIMLRVAQRTVSSIRTDLFDKLQNLPIRYFDQNNTGDIMSLFTNDMDMLQNALEQSVVQLISGILMFIGSTVALILLSPLLFLGTLVMLVIMLVVATKITKRSGKQFQAQQANIARVNATVEELVDGQHVVKVFNHEAEAQKQFEEVTEAYRQSATMAQTYAGVIMPTMNNLNNANFALTALAGGVLTIMGRFDVGSLVSYLQFARNFTQPLQQISNQVNNVLGALAGAERIFKAMDEAPEIDNGNVTLVPCKIVEIDGQRKMTEIEVDPESDAAVISWAWKRPIDGGKNFELIELRGDVRFHDVTFGYVPDKTILKDISLYAKPGQKIAFVGSTGAGKTTITNLINRFYEIDSGQITYDGIDVKDIKKNDLRHSLGMVLQDTHLFTGTVADNIRYGRLRASDGEVKAAARMASASKFIQHLPEQYDTMITGDGESLSQGQRQLLAIARATVANPPVLILDEATSSIDTRTEKYINEGMDALMQGRTVFVIAHRLSTVRDADAIMVIEAGQIIEKGNHEELLAQKGRYYELYTGKRELE